MGHNHPAADHVCAMWDCTVDPSEEELVQAVARAIAGADTFFVTVDLNVDPNQVRYERLARAALSATRKRERSA